MVIVKSSSGGIYYGDMIRRCGEAFERVNLHNAKRINKALCKQSAEDIADSGLDYDNVVTEVGRITIPMAKDVYLFEEEAERLTLLRYK